MITFLRQKGYGHKSVAEIIKHMSSSAGVVRSDEVPAKADELQGTVIRWGCRTPLSLTPELIINPGKRIKRTSDKRGSRITLAGQGLAPLTWPSIEALVEEQGHPDKTHEPESIVVRPAHHMKGKNFHLCSDIYEIEAAAKACGPGYYLSEYIPKVAEYRIMAVRGRAVWVCNKPGSLDNPAWNHMPGQPFTNVKWGQWPIEAVKVGLQAAAHFKLDFTAVDVMVDSGGRAYVLELNSAPAMTSNYRTTCLAKGLDYTLANPSQTFDNQDNIQGWKDAIHPAIWSS